MFRSLLVLVLLIPFLATAQLSSPSEFLGYAIGSRYSPHFRVVDYFKHVASAMPGNVKLEQYGITNEGRPLLLAYIASAENLRQLETIRKQNIGLAGFENQTSSNKTNPAIIWLSYNVHGNETSSSEAAMLTIYELIKPENADSREWLKNTVVIIDPCVNPDGRDRYVNWFNSVVGNKPNPKAFTREHIEPWPGGRMNHYYFDLNRDWAWQTQVESQQRLIKYNQWLPHVHVDFHEQGYNEPYYFAPAAEPFHEVITEWQREFQTMIGRNNAKYFDRNGWLYFTKERFDLFYPSYGDTYPTYKGAIGMTYEQGGHSRAGAAVINEDGDTLTLLDRLTHHFTTGMATVEITSQNASRVVQEFRNYFHNAQANPPGDFKAYLIKADAGDRLARLIRLLDRNAIKWSYAASGNYSGLNYLTGKTENVKYAAGDIVINANQPNSNLIKVLFERHSKLSDSATYDITAWSVPYVYGVSTYGLSNYVSNTTNSKPAGKMAASEPNAYAYAIPWNGMHSAKLLSSLLNKGIKVRYAEQGFSIGDKHFDKGTLLVTRTSNFIHGDSLELVINRMAVDAGVSYTPLKTGFVDKGYDIGSGKVRSIKAPRVGLVAGENVSPLGMGEIWHFFDMELEYPVNIIWNNNLNKNILNELDVLIFPDGNHRNLADKTSASTIRDWVSNGGKLIVLENALKQLSEGEWGIRIKSDEDKKEEKKDDKKEDYSLLRRYENRERDFLTGFNPGSIFRVEMDNSHPLAFGYEGYYHTLKLDNNIYEFLKEDGWNVGIVKKENFVSGFTGSKAKEKLKDGLLFGVKEMGRGNIVMLADNPLFRSFWENGKLLFANAVFMVGQ